MPETILITGGTGFAGSHLVDLLKTKHDSNQIHVTTLGKDQQLPSDWLPISNIHQVDLSDLKATRKVFAAIKPTQIYHLASFSTVENSFDLAGKILAINSQIQHAVLAAIKDLLNPPRMLFISSAAVYASQDRPLTEDDPIKPDNPYGVSKYTQELLTTNFVDAYKLDVVTTRPFNHLGERQAPNFSVSAFAKQIAEIEHDQKSSLEVGNLKAIRDFTDVKDMVKAYEILMESGQSGQIYNIGSQQPTSMQDVVDQLIKLAKVDIKLEQDPSRIRPIDVPYIVADSQKISALGWKPEINLKQTLTRTLNYWRDKV